jgi:endoglucanase
MSKQTDPFPFRRGSNLGGWLSQANVLDEEHLASFYRREHIARLAAAGADHLRLPVDYELIEEPEPPHRLREQGMKWVEQAIEWAWAEGLGVTLDLHKCAGMSFFTPETNGLWEDAGLQRRFAGLWRQLAEHFRDAPHDRLALELLNEPTAEDNLLWSDVAAQALAAIREVDPRRWVVIGSNSWNVPSTFPDLHDFRDPRVAYAVHWYEPFIFTHQKAPWCEWLKTLDLTVDYPSQLPDLSSRQSELPSPAEREQLMLFSEAKLGYERMERWFAPVAEFAERTGAPIYCTEFGCWDPAPPQSQLDWFRDSITLFEAHNVAWAQWEYSCLFERDGTPKPPLAVLFEKTPARPTKGHSQ